MLDMERAILAKLGWRIPSSTPITCIGLMLAQHEYEDDFILCCYFIHEVLFRIYATLSHKPTHIALVCLTYASRSMKKNIDVSFFKHN
jgi:hypothetical protein